MTCPMHSGFVITGFLAMFSFGMVGSLHCFGMCGPLSSLLGTTPDKRITQGAYHAGRLLSYMALGGLLAVLGSPLKWMLPWPWPPLLWGLPLLIFAFRPIQAPAWMAKLHLRAAKLALGWQGPTRGFVLGLLTPLLPCGLLYAASAAALAAPNPGTAAAWMAAFALGSAPGLWLGQQTLGWIAQVRGGIWTTTIQRSIAVITAFIILFLSRPSA